MSIYDRFGVRTIINAKGPSTRLSGGLLDAEVTAAMTEAAGYCVDMAELQAGASTRTWPFPDRRPSIPAAQRSACRLP